MNKLKILLLAAIGTMLITSGCQVIKADKKIKAEEIGQDEQAKLDMIADRYGEELLKAIQDNDYELFITIDGDEQHSPNEIPGFIERINSEKFDIVAGNRMNNAENMPKKRSA